MVIALFALAFAMIVGGLMAIVQGWDIVQVERGWSLVIAGSVGAAGGALLLGIAAAVARLTAIRSDLAQLRERLGRQEPSLPPAPVYDPVAAASAGLLAGGGSSGGLMSPDGSKEPAEDDAQPTLPLFLRPGDQEGEKRPEPDPLLDLAAREPAPDEEDREAEPHAPAADAEARLPDDFFEDRERRAPERDREPLAEAEDDDHPWLRRRPEPKFETEAEREPEPEEVGPDATEEPPAEDSPATVIGTYTSGPNRYVMFSDGSIEADTPQGVFRFGSLDELKQFIASGGEGDGPRST
jgi:hypothetical protein